ncbi:TPA: hypothetical protein EYP37_11755 [Candidatus Poribacteria bacterium]|nr:hypothetical protein [Candidatus Poribacteria bacterium]
MITVKEEDELSLFYIEHISSRFENPLILRITLGEMPLADGLYACFEMEELPEDMKLAELIDKAAHLEPDERDIKVNPDLPDIMNSLKSLLKEQEEGLVEIRYYRNGTEGPIDPNGRLRGYLKGLEIKGKKCNLIDIVLEVKEVFDPLEGIPPSEREDFLLSLRSAYLLYKLSRSKLTPDGISDRVKPILDNLIENGLVEVADGRWVLTQEGQEAIELLFEEASYYIDRYEIFGDVEFEGDEIRFNTGNGVNLIVRAMERDGLSPQRAFFILSIYFGHLDDLENWQEEIFSEELLRGIFWDIFHSPPVDEIGEETLERIMIAAEKLRGRGDEGEI